MPTVAGTVTGVNICSLLPQSQVAQITGETVDVSTPRTSPLIANDVGCTYGNGQVTSEVLIDVVTPGGAANYNGEVAYYSNAMPVTGFGDKAFTDDTDGLGFVALFGDTEFTVFIGDEDNKVGDITAASEAIITALRAKM